MPTGSTENDEITVGAFEAANRVPHDRAAVVTRRLPSGLKSIVGLHAGNVTHIQMKPAKLFTPDRTQPSARRKLAMRVVPPTHQKPRCVGA